MKRMSHCNRKDEANTAICHAIRAVKYIILRHVVCIFTIKRTEFWKLILCFILKEPKVWILLFIIGGCRTIIMNAFEEIWNIFPRHTVPESIWHMVWFLLIIQHILKSVARLLEFLWVLPIQAICIRNRLTLKILNISSS